MVMDNYEYFDPERVFSDKTLINHLLLHAKRLLRSASIAREVVVDVLIDLKDRPIGHIQSLRAYLYTCVTYKCLALLNEKKRFPTVPESSRQDVADDNTESKYFAIVAKIFPDVMDLLRNVCTQEQYEVFGYWINGKHYEEIANIKNMTIGAVGSALHRAKANARSLAPKVRQMMDKLEG